ncbi:putative amidase [Ilyonectria robusta]|uniref:putative amidase n=1 Tax=Ilyonectria robusta TaxID=1079257 RepID=UPI001E8D80B4|nr:putative amidase [Ilyonectria robusta]KAH8686207.1 putative amidase [Ilyonectria robusta]
MAITDDAVHGIASGVGFAIPDADLKDYVELLEKFESSLEAITNSEDYQPVPDFEASARTNVHFPEEADNALGGWAWRCTCVHREPPSLLLENKTFCLKDNIAMAGVPCLLGTESFTGWIPKTDATVVTRILSHSGTISGKAVCENLSRGAVSSTAATGPVHNPYAKGYSAGGSSSGTAALVGSGAVDMGIGCDQGGSIRIPAGLCGLYGFKATVGLVPYTGIASNDASVDYVGPMTRTCLDCAKLLQAIAGADGMDDRQIAGTPFVKDVPKYAEILEATRSQGVKGMRIGILKEGLSSPMLDSEVEKKFKAAVAEFAKLGAIITEVSVPMHQFARTIYVVMSKMGNHMGMQGRATGRRQVMLTDLLEKKSFPFSQDSVSKMNTVSKEGLLSGEFGWQNHPLAYAKAINLSRKLQHEYDTVLDEVDLLVMPTTVTPSNPLPPVGATPRQDMDASAGKLENTSPFNASGHPALAVPIGFVPAKDDPKIMLPASIQIVGKYWDEARILRAAYAWENSIDWRTF